METELLSITATKKTHEYIFKLLSDTSTVFAAGNTIEFPAGEEFNTTPSHHVYTDIVRELSVQVRLQLNFRTD